VHWLLLLACEQLGIAAASFLSGEGAAAAPLLSSVDLVLAEPHFPRAQSRRQHVITPEWRRDVLAPFRAGAEPEPAASKAPDDPVRLLRTSGTMGPAKHVVVLRRMHEAMIAEGIACFGLNQRSRYLQSMPLFVRAAFDFGSGVLRMGGTLVLETRMGLAAAAGTHEVTHAIYLPALLKAALDELPGNFVKPRDLTIMTFGAGIPETLRERATARLVTRLCDLYGTVEMGAISASWGGEGDGFGTPWPGAEIEVVDEEDRVLAPGNSGHIRIKTPWMCERYLNDPETTQRMFRQGWFYPGDFGLARSDGKVLILGRTDDILNVSGQKIQPAGLEAWLVNQQLAGDVGVCSIPNEDGIEEFCIALAGARYDDRELVERIRPAFKDGRFHVARIGSIPRSPNGKIQRKLLKEEVVRAARRR